MKASNLIIISIIFFLFSCSEKTIEMSPTPLDSVVISANKDIRSLIFRYEITNKANKLLTNVNVRVAAPVSESQRHHVENLDVNMKYQLEVDKQGNQTILMNFDHFAPYSTQVVIVKVKIINSNKLELKEPIGQEFLIESEFVPFLDEEFRSVNQLVKGNTELETITNAYHWVNSHMNYSGYLPDDYGALYALRNGRGDCTEYMYLLAALLRANNVSTRLVAGYIYQDDHLVDAADYHNWVEVFYKGKWQVVDALKGHLLGSAMDYVVMRYLDSNEGYIHESQKFSSSKLLSVKMF